MIKSVDRDGVLDLAGVDNDIPNGIGMIYRLCRYDILKGV